MPLSDIGIPTVDIKSDAISFSPYFELTAQFYRYLMNDETGRTIIAALNAHPRVASLQGKMINYGSSCHRFDVHVLAMWFIWYANQHGRTQASQQLESFLDAEMIPLVNTLWVLGIEVDEPIVLENGLTIQPIETMPESQDKEFFLRIDAGGFVQSSPRPRAAFTCVCYVNKTLEHENGKFVFDKNIPAKREQMTDVAMLLNALTDVSCLPYYVTIYSTDSMPFGPFSPTGGGSPFYDVLGHASAKLSGQNKADINGLIADFDRCDENKKKTMRLILSRISQAKRRGQLEDKFLDLGIALEMLLLSDNLKYEQLALSFRLRGAWLIGSSGEDRAKIFDQLRKMYDYRSQVAHGGALKDKDQEKLRRSFPEYQSLAERICRKILAEGIPDWNKIVLNAP